MQSYGYLRENNVNIETQAVIFVPMTIHLLAKTYHFHEPPFKNPVFCTPSPYGVQDIQSSFLTEKQVIFRSIQAIERRDERRPDNPHRGV